MRRTASDLSARHQCGRRDHHPAEACPGRRRLGSLGSSPALYLSVITVAEIEAGIEGTPDPARRTAFGLALTNIRDQYRDRIAAVGEREAPAYLALHRKLKSAGTSIDPPDALIAATALANGWTLVSRNAKHLARSGALLLNPWAYEG